MGFLKYAFVFVALFACTWAANTTWGSRNATDILLYSQIVERLPVAHDYAYADVVFPANGQTNNRTITAIVAEDRFTNNAYATNTLRSGGIGYRFATVDLRSQYGRGINSTVQFYGRF